MRPAVSFAREDTLPDELFHYTGAAAFEQIIRLGVLRATNFRFLDDPTEVTYGLDLVVPELDQRRDAASSSNVATFWQHTADRLRDAALAEFYVCCFTGVEDDVSQWRAFGGGSVRYSLGFNASAFQPIANNVSGQFDSIIYKRESQTDRIGRILDKASEFLATNKISRTHVRSLAAVAARHLVQLMTRFKSPKYEAEHEWRIFIEKPHTSAEHVSFDASRGYLRPYLELPLRVAGDLPLTSLWVLAPGRSDGAVRAGTLVLQAANITNVVPKPSTVPIAL
ncbi:MAG: DUF2971 domain-containing protein [Thermoanaerobaculia bacterium]